MPQIAIMVTVLQWLLGSNCRNGLNGCKDATILAIEAIEKCNNYILRNLKLQIVEITS
jgi:hypothetical protein